MHEAFVASELPLLNMGIRIATPPVFLYHHGMCLGLWHVCSGINTQNYCAAMSLKIIRSSLVSRLAVDKHMPFR
jgi:hypothetical protein